jgi:hypothetical protein
MSVNYLVSGKGGTHLPVSNSSGEPDHRLMGAAFAALHGGYRGNKYAGPNKAAAIAKLKAMYDSEKMAMPSESFFVPEPKDSLMYEVDGTTMKDDSYDAIRCRVSSALNHAIEDGEDMDLDGDNDSGADGCGCGYAYIVDLFPATVVYSMDGDLFQCEYHDDGENVTLGTPVEVEQSYTVVADDSAADAADEEQESSRALVGSVLQLEESAYDAAKGELTMTVMKPGFSKNKTEGRQRFYPAATLKRDHKIFEGAKMFADHQTDKESKDRPEGSVNNWVAQISKVWTESDGTIKAKADVIDPPFKQKLGALNEKGLLPQMGVSVRIGAEVSKAQIEGQEAMSIDAMLSNRSVDFVTYAGAGGAVEMMESANDATENDLELATEAQLRKRRPDLVQLIESKSHGQEAMMSKTIEALLQESNTALAAEKVRADAAEAKAKKLQETSDEQVASIATLTTKITEAEVAAQKATAQTELGKMLAESQLAKLPEAVRPTAYKRITAQFTEAVSTDGMKEAISSEEAFIKLMNGPAKVTKMGEKDNATVERKTNLKESFMRRGMPEKEAEIAAAGRR